MHQLPIRLQTFLRRFQSDSCRGSTILAAPCDLFPFKQNYVRGSDVYLKRFPVQSSWIGTNMWTKRGDRWNFWMNIERKVWKFFKLNCGKSAWFESHKVLWTLLWDRNDVIPLCNCENLICTVVSVRQRKDRLIIPITQGVMVSAEKKRVWNVKDVGVSQNSNLVTGSALNEDESACVVVNCDVGLSHHVALFGLSCVVDQAENCLGHATECSASRWVLASGCSVDVGCRCDPVTGNCVVVGSGL